MMKNLADASGGVLVDSECITYLIEQVTVLTVHTLLGSLMVVLCVGVSDLV